MAEATRMSTSFMSTPSASPSGSPLSSPSTPQVQYLPIRSPLLEASQLPALDSPSSRHTHIHIHSHFPHHLPPLDASSASSLLPSSSSSISPISASPSWIVTASSPSTPTKRFNVALHAPSKPSSKHAWRRRFCAWLSFSASSSSPSSSLTVRWCCGLPFSVKFFVLICALAAFLLYQTHLCTIADEQPQSALSFLHSTLHPSGHPHNDSHHGSSLITLSMLTSPSASPSPSSWSSLLSSDVLIDPWQQRLLPISVEMEAGYAWLTLNLVLLTGAAHAPPVYEGVPCLRSLALNAPASSTCVHQPLQLVAHEQYSITVVPMLRRTEDSLLPSDQSYAPVTELGEWRWLSERQVQHLSTDIPGQLSREARGEDGELTLDSAAQALANAVMPVVARVQVPALLEGRTYVFSVEVGNRTHRTAAVLSLPARSLPQIGLFHAERQRIARYLNLVSDPAQPAPFSPPLPFRSPVSVSPHRQPAPFEVADASCPSAFMSWVDEYRRFHTRQVSRLRAAKGDVSRLAALVSDAVDPVRVLVSGVYRWSGVTDRASALTGIYLMAMLTRRVLLLDDDWPDIQRVMLSPLTLSLEHVNPALRDPGLANWTQVVEVSDVGPLTDGYDEAYNQSVVLITSIKGIVMRVLTESSNYSRPLQALGLNPDNVIGCLAHSLWTVRLSSLLAVADYQSTMRLLLHPRTTGVGIQIRSWHDYVFLEQARARKSGQYTPHATIATGGWREARRQAEVLTEFGTQGFFHCAQDVSDTLRLTLPPPPASQVVWFLVSDDEAVRAAAVSRWGQRQAVDASPVLVSLLSAAMLGHSNAVDLDAGFLFLRHALVEQFLFSLTHWAVVSQSSGYGRWPALLGLRGRRVFVLNNDHTNVTRKAAKTCMDEARDGVTILALSKEWSKV